MYVICCKYTKGEIMPHFRHMQKKVVVDFRLELLYSINRLHSSTLTYTAMLPYSKACKFTSNSPQISRPSDFGQCCLFCTCRMTVRHTRTREDLSRGSRRRAWLTRAQLMKMYGNSTAMVDNLIAKKISENSFRPHPDLPEVPEATLYHVSCES